MSYTNEAFVLFKPESYHNQKTYKEIHKRLKLKFDIRAMWPKVANAAMLEVFSLSKEYEGQRFLCAIVRAKNKDTVTLDLIKEVIGRDSNPKRCMLGSIRRDLGGDRDLLLYSQTVKEVADHIAIWRPVFVNPPVDGYGKDGYGEKE